MPLRTGYDGGLPGLRATGDTKMFDDFLASLGPEELAAYEKSIQDNIALQRLGDPRKDVAPVVAFLLSDGARYLTGQMIPVDGGFAMSR